MLNYLDLQVAYTNIYKAIRKYFWPFRTVNDLADFEVAVFRAFPDIGEVSSLFSRLKADVREEYKQDDDMKSAFDKFEELIESIPQCYVKLNLLQEE